MSQWLKRRLIRWETLHGVAVEKSCIGHSRPVRQYADGRLAASTGLGRQGMPGRVRAAGL